MAGPGGYGAARAAPSRAGPPTLGLVGRAGKRDSRRQNAASDREKRPWASASNMRWAKIGFPASGTISPPICRPRPRASSRHRQADRPRRSRAALPDGADRPRGLDRARDRDSRSGARDLPHVAPDAALPRAPAGKAARHHRAHLLQIRGRQPGRQPQAQHRRRAGLLQPAGGGQEALDRDRRGAMGLVARLRRRAVRPRGQGLHGQGLV